MLISLDCTMHPERIFRGFSVFRLAMTANTAKDVPQPKVRTLLMGDALSFCRRKVKKARL